MKINIIKIFGLNSDNFNLLLLYISVSFSKFNFIVSISFCNYFSLFLYHLELCSIYYSNDYILSFHLILITTDIKSMLMFNILYKYYI